MAESYPPPHHILSDLGLQIDRRSGELTVRLPVTPYLLDARGALRAGILGVAFDVFAGNLAVDAARPDWALTSELALHRLFPVEKGTLVVTGHALRAGRTQLVVEAEARCEEGGRAPCALGHIGFTRVARRADTPESPSDPPDVYSFGAAGASLAEPLLAALGVVPAPDAAAGRLELPLTPYVRNSVGGLQGGAVVSLVDAAAAAAAAARTGAPAAVEDLSVRFLALGRAGPVRSEATLLRHSDEAVLLRVALRDTGQDGRLVSMATASVRPA
jgi:uncharacterized protein (TIGR00369 family)